MGTGTMKILTDDGKQDRLLQNYEDLRYRLNATKTARASIGQDNLDDLDNWKQTLIGHFSDMVETYGDTEKTLQQIEDAINSLFNEISGN